MSDSSEFYRPDREHSAYRFDNGSKCCPIGYVVDKARTEQISKPNPILDSTYLHSTQCNFWFNFESFHFISFYIHLRFHFHLFSFIFIYFHGTSFSVLILISYGHAKSLRDCISARISQQSNFSSLLSWDLPTSASILHYRTQSLLG